METKITFTGAVKLEIREGFSPVIFRDVDITDRLWELAGAFDGSVIRVRRSTVGTDAGTVEAIELKVIHSGLLQRPMVRRIFEVDDGVELIDVIDNVEFYLKPDYQGQGIGATSLMTQALAAYSLGIQKIWAIAAGGDGSGDIGYRVWPKLGYDAQIPDDVLQKMPRNQLVSAGIDLTKPVLLSNLIDVGLFSLWEEHGSGCLVEFDVSSLDSWSMLRLASQLEKDSES